MAAAQSSSALLTNAVDILSLPPERSQTGIPVLVEGVVTAAQPDWQGRFFVQDTSAGIFVENISATQPNPGDVVRVRGITHPGGFAPIITQPQWEKLGTAELPPAKPVSIDALMSGIEDSQRIEISGIVRAARVEESAVIYEVTSGGYRLRVYTPVSAAGDPQLLVGSRVRLRGTAATSFHAELRHLVTVTVYVPRASDWIIEKSNPENPFVEPVIPLDEVAQYRRSDSPGKRIHVRGIVVHQRPGLDVFLQDETGGLRVKSRQLEPLAQGTVVDAIGFPDYEQFLPVLDDAVLRETREPPQSPLAREAELEVLQRGLHHADLITIRGRLLDVAVSHDDTPTSEPLSGPITLTVQTSNFLFAAEGPPGDSNARLMNLPLGSLIELTGVCLLHIRMGGTMESGDVGTMESLHLLLPSADDVHVLERPSWLTPKRLLMGVALLSGVLMLALSWIVTISRKNLSLKTLVREKVKAQEELQKAHDLLEERVQERTAQLKFETDARQEAEIRFKATLSERTRLAQELHDTLEQSLIGIGLQLDTAAKLAEQRSTGANRPLEMARNLMSRSQLELRRSIWDLRSRELEQFDFPHALRANAEEILDGTDVALEFNITGQPQRLSEIIEENLLRIAREALTNIIKHARAARVAVSLHYTARDLTLEVSDNGLGFTPGNCPGSTEGHFGLTGMSERAKRIGGNLAVNSSLGQGTRIRISVTLEPLKEPRLGEDVTARP